MAQWGVVTFGRGVDRALATAALTEKLRARGIKLAGFRQEGRPGEQEKKAVELVRLAGEGRALLGAAGTKAPSDGEGCSFGFREEAFALGQSWLASDCPEAEVVLLHEVSKLELSGGGHDAAVRQALALPDGKVVVLCTRAERLPEVVDRYAPPSEPVAYLALPAPEPEEDAFVDGLSARLRAPGAGG